MSGNSLQKKVENMLQIAYCDNMQGKICNSNEYICAYMLFLCKKNESINIIKSCIDTYDFDELGEFEKSYFPLFIYILLFLPFDQPLLIECIIEVNCRFASKSISRLLHGIIGRITKRYLSVLYCVRLQ